MQFEFDWDPVEAESNRHKHGVAFETAMGVFDPLALLLLEKESGEAEERWVTMGRNPDVHTCFDLSADRAAIRIISARQPTWREIRSYEDS